MAIPRVLFAESFQHVAVGTYPMMIGGYATTSRFYPADCTQPNGQIDYTKNPLATQNGRGLPNGGSVAGSCTIFAGRAIGHGTEAANVMPTWSPTNPFGKAPFNHPALVEDYSAVGFSIVPCPTRPGRKRLAMPGKSCIGKPLLSTTAEAWAGIGHMFSLRYATGLSPTAYPYASTLNISFVVRFTKRTQSTWFAWTTSIGWGNQGVRGNTQYGGNYGPTYTCPGFFASYITFGTADASNRTSATISDSNGKTNLLPLPWADLAPDTNTDAQIPNPTAAGLDGAFYKFDYDRDYHIEIVATPPSSDAAGMEGRPSTQIMIDGVVVRKFYKDVAGPSVAEDKQDVSLRSRALANIQINHAMLHWKGGATNATTTTPSFAEEMGQIYISDLVVGYSGVNGSTDAFGPTTRVWGEMPNEDRSVQFNNPAAPDSNASVVGSAMKSNIPGENVELSGKSGQSDSYVTSGSSMPDHVGTVLAVNIRGQGRAEGAASTVQLTFNGEEHVNGITLDPTNGARYSNLNWVATLPPEGITPEAAADATFGIKVK